MRRVVALFLPTFATDHHRRANGGKPQADIPLVTAHLYGGQRLIACADAAATRAGLREGITIAHAQALVPNLVIVPADEERERAALERLAHWCTRYSPLVTPDGTQCVYIDIAGSAHLFKGEAALLEDLRKRILASRLTARTAIADTPGCAFAVARFGAGDIVAPGRGSDALGSLPVAALRLEAGIVESLRDVGIERIAQLATKPRASLRTRFGAEVLLRLDQALGSVHEVLTPIAVPEVPQTGVKFAEGVGTADDLGRITSMLCERLVRDLEMRGIGARRLDLVFTRVDHVTQAVRIGTSRPNRDAKHLTKLLSERLVLVDPGFGIEEACLIASWVEALTERQMQTGHVEGNAVEADVASLVDTLRIRLGAERVFRFAPFESDVPERAVRRVTAIGGRDTPWPADLPRPARLLLPPEEVQAVAEVPDAPPLFFVWCKQRHRVIRADGPERILGEWWVCDREIGMQRDYYRVETESGERFWLFRDAPVQDGGRWWLHGLGEA